MPRLPLTLHHNGQAVEVFALLDTGAAVNLLPYSVGLALGADWSACEPLATLTGASEHSARWLLGDGAPRAEALG